MTPTLRTFPILTIELNGQVVSDSFAAMLTSIRVQQRLSMPTLCELCFDRSSHSAHAQPFKLGSNITVRLNDLSVPLFEGYITAIEYVYTPMGERKLFVRGYDKLHKLRRRQQVRVHKQVTAADLARELTADLGLTIKQTEKGPLWANLYQYDQSDLGMLIEISETCGLYFTLRENVLHLITLQGIGDATPLALGESLLEMRAELNGNQINDEVGTTGWNPLTAQTHQGHTRQSRSGRHTMTNINAQQMGGNSDWRLNDEATTTDEQAEGLAQAELDRRVTGALTVWGVAEGDPTLRPGTPIDLSEIDNTLCGRYIVSEATHTIDAERGFISEFSSRPPTARPRHRDAVSTIGVVSQVNDPANLGRVRVTLPTYNDVESDWLLVLASAGGADKGLIALPDVGDTVLLLLTHGNPGDGIVLGGLYGMTGAPDSGVERGEVQRYTFLTRGGQRIQLDDGANGVRINNADGSYLEMLPNKVHLHAATHLEIEAPGQSIVLRAKAIDLQSG